MKKCYTCKKLKELNEFNKNKSRKDGLQSKCKKCDRERAITYFHENKTTLLPNILKNRRKRKIEVRNYIISYLKEHPCVDCNNTDIRVLEFDHFKDKIHGISYMLSGGYSLKRVVKEIEKCEVRCANCHRIKTAEQFNHHGYLAETD